jgi:UDP-N-acetylglucosamine--N-acetylmuramyl-(pentapeptide) pyrophosphoryl-undecaprenol N-acetylglucosamine transferase
LKRRGACILFACGGTGGHLYPAVAVADEIKRRKPDADIMFVGTKGKIESRVVPLHGYRFRTIWVSGIPRQLKLASILFPLKVLVALVQSYMIVRKIRPAVVVGTGGYVCGPPLYVANLLGVPTLIQEQNSHPGLTTRLLAPRATQVHISFEASRTLLKRQDNIRLTGNPTRSTIGGVPRNEGAMFFGLDPGRKTLLVFGGSQGAIPINRAILRILSDLTSMGAQILWQTGDGDFENIKRLLTAQAMTQPERVCIHGFIERMENAYAASDLAVCRAGATTLAELMQAGLPSVLVPLPSAAADHQTANAKSMAEAGASIVCSEERMEENLLDIIVGLIRDPSRLLDMAQHARSLGRTDATAVLADAVLDLAER